MAIALLCSVGATGAQAAPTLHCEASALRATLAGTQTVEPIVQGRAGDCVTGEAVPTASLPALLSASTLTARTTYDAAGATGTAEGAITDTAVHPTPDLLAQLPTEQAIDALPAQSVTVPQPLAAALALLGLPSTLSLDLRDAVRALVPTPGATALLSASMLQANATASCQAGVPVLTGSSDIGGVKLLGQDVGVTGTLTQALPLINSQSIALSQLDVSKIHILTSLDGITGPLLAQVQAALIPLLSVLPPIQLPASVLDVELTRDEQIADGGSLTQHALHASITLLGGPILDAVFGEAKVSATADTCAPPPAVTPPPTVAAPTPKPKPATPKAALGGQGVAEQLLACSDRKLVLIDVLQQDGHVKLLGAANRSYAGKRVAIRLRATGKVVAHATVSKDGAFQTAAPLPARAYLASHERANRVRYRAEIGKERSLPLKLQRRMIVSSLTARNGKVTIRGHVVLPLTTPVSTIRLVRRVSCHKVVLVKRFKPRADGTFSVTVKAPTGQAAAIYRLATSVREQPGNPRSYPTFTLPRGVALDTR